MTPTRPADRIVVNIRDKAAFKPFIVDGQALPRQGFIQLDDTFPEGAGLYVYRMEPGAVTQAHEHTRVPSRKSRQPCSWRFRHLRDKGARESLSAECGVYLAIAASEPSAIAGRQLRDTTLATSSSWWSRAS